MNTNVEQGRHQIKVASGIAKRLEMARKKAGLSQCQVAERAGVSQGTIGNIETGLRKSPRELLAIAAAVGVSPHWLKTGIDPAPGMPPSGFAAPQAPDLSAALAVVLNALAALTPGKWDMVSARLGALPGRPEAVADVLNDVAPVLGLPVSLKATPPLA